MQSLKVCCVDWGDRNPDLRARPHQPKALSPSDPTALGWRAGEGSPRPGSVTQALTLTAASVVKTKKNVVVGNRLHLKQTASCT